MTRINVGIPPAELSGRHLIAEHREIKRVPNLVKYNLEMNNPITNIPEKFTLGKGHVRFFYNKLKYLLDRYRQVYDECINRRYNVQNYESAWNDIPNELMGDYEPTKEDAQLIKQRIEERNASSQNILK